MENSLRENVARQMLNTKKRHIILEAATGVGKTKLALDKTNQLYSPDARILIVIPRNVLIQNWINEFKRWEYIDMLNNVTFVTYVSMPKMAGTWDIVIMDEAHHLSARCQQAMRHFHIKHCLFLSATLKKEHKDFIQSWTHGDVAHISVTTKKAIENEVLPDPKIILIPLTLDSMTPDWLWYSRKQWKKLPLSHITIFNYEDKWKALRMKKVPHALRCTQKQYYREMSGLIEWYKGKRNNPVMKNLWLQECNQRLHWLSLIKLPFTRRIIRKLHSRFIVFCNTIAESQALDIPAVNSNEGFDNLERFNAGDIDSLVAVNCLNEGVNLVDCKVGIFNAINASEIMQVQKVGRELRHNSPVIIIPYFKNTREEEIVRKWMQNFGKSPITIKTIDEL